MISNSFKIHGFLCDPLCLIRFSIFEISSLDFLNVIIFFKFFAYLMVILPKGLMIRISIARSKSSSVGNIFGQTSFFVAFFEPSFGSLI